MAIRRKDYDKMNEWHEKWARECKGCGNKRSFTEGFGSDFFMNKTCKSCGEYEGDWISCKTTRYVSNAKWLNPLTWLSRSWEVKNEKHENPDHPKHDSFMSFYHR